MRSQKDKTRVLDKKEDTYGDREAEINFLRGGQWNTGTGCPERC